MTSFAPDMSGTSRSKFQAIKLGTNEEITVTGTSAQSAAFAAGVNIVRVVCTVACRVVFGTNPTATATDPYMPADGVEYFAVKDDGLQKIAIIRESASGKATVTQGSTTEG